MSNYLAIATATQTIRQILQDAARLDVSGAQVKTVQPNAPKRDLPDVGINVYLYQVTPNAAWRNADIPTRRSNGDLIQRPRVAVDLHYLLTFYGNEGQLEPQRLLGSAISALHDQPILSREKIRQVIDDAIATDPNHYLSTSDLYEEVELVKFSPLPLSLEELSKLWSVFFQTSYKLSTAYLGTVVLIERTQPPEPALPVRARTVRGVPFRQPTIERVEALEGQDAPITTTSKLRILGRQLYSDTMRIRIGGVEPALNLERVTDTEIVLPVPDGVAAGVQAIQVVQPMLLGEPQVEHTGITSNVMPFVLRPTISAAVGAITSSVENGTTYHATTITVTFQPEVEKDQQVTLLLNEYQTTPTPDPLAYALDAPSWDDIALPPGITSTPTIDIPISRIIPGDYLVRVQVDGAESLLGRDAAGRYATPKVTI